MHAYEIPNLRFSLPAGADIARRRFVSVNSSSTAVYATSAGSAIGVSMDDAEEGNVLTIADGIVTVEAGAAIAAGADVEVGADGKAITKTTGIGVGVAITGASGTGQIIAVKLMSVSNANGADGADGNVIQTITYTSTDLTAGADLAAVPIGVVVGDGTIIDVSIISTGTASGIDASNTSVFLLEAEDPIAGITFNDTTVFPAASTATPLTVTKGAVAAGKVLLLSVTNGATADLPIFVVQVVVALD